MTAELWLHKPCKHGYMSEHNDGTRYEVAGGFIYGVCVGGKRVRLDPDRVVEFGYKGWVKIKVGEFIDALTEPQTSETKPQTQETDQ